MQPLELSPACAVKGLMVECIAGCICTRRPFRLALTRPQPIHHQEKERTTPRLIWPGPSFPFGAIEPLQFFKPALFLDSPRLSGVSGKFSKSVVTANSTQSLSHPAWEGSPVLGLPHLHGFTRVALRKEVDGDQVPPIRRCTTAFTVAITLDHHGDGLLGKGLRLSRPCPIRD